MSADVKLGYKQTDIGVIPNSWAVRTVEEVGRVVTGGTPSTAERKYWGSEYPWVTPTDIQAVRDICCTARMLSKEGLDKIRPLPEGSVLVTCIASIGKVAVLTAEGGCNQQINAVIPFQDNNKNFLYYYFISKKLYLLENAGTTATPILSKSKFGKLFVCCPPASEQDSISEVLSSVDALISSLDRLIAKKRDIQQAAMQQLLTGKRRLPGFSGEWEVKRLGDFADLKQGYVFKSEWYTELGPFKVATIANVQDGWMKTNDCNRISILPKDIQPHHILMVGEIIISMTGNVGRICKVSEDGWILNQRVGKIIPAKINPEYLFFLLSLPSFSKAMMNLAKGGAQGNLSASDITGFELWLPTSIDEMAAIATILSDIASEITSLEARCDKARQLKQGMMQELLTGRIRLA